MVKKGFIALVLIGLLMVPALAVAGKAPVTFTVKVWPKDGDPMIIKDFYPSEGRNGTFEYVEWRGSNINIDISTIREIVLGEHKGHGWLYCEILFKDGTKEKFSFKPGGLYGTSKYGKWSMSPGQVVKIRFIDGESENAISSAEISAKLDKVNLKNGDVVSGEILTETFKLKTSYGELEFNAEDIKTINLEGGGNNVDVVTLRVGDKLSGVIQNDKIRVKMSSGATIELDRDKVKDILFKE